MEKISIQRISYKGKPIGILRFAKFKKVLTVISLISNCLIDVLGRKTLKSDDEGETVKIVGVQLLRRQYKQLSNSV